MREKTNGHQGSTGTFCHYSKMFFYIKKHFFHKYRKVFVLTEREKEQRTGEGETQRESSVGSTPRRELDAGQSS